MQTFLDYYQQEIQPQIAAIDLFLKTEDPPYSHEIAAELLEIPFVQWEEILAEEKISFLTKGVFFHMMEKGRSPLCGMFRRAVELHLPELYTPEIIAYVFDLPISAVRKATQELGRETFTEELLPKLFSKISLAETRFLF